MSDILDSLLDSTLDDLADLPEVKPYPVGAHRCTVTFEAKEINKKPTVFVHLVAQETMELSNPGDEPLAPGAKASCMYMLVNNDGQKNEIAQGQLKSILTSVREGLGIASGTNRDLMEAAKGIEVMVVTKQRTNKDTGQVNTVIMQLSVL